MKRSCSYYVVCGVFTGVFQPYCDYLIPLCVCLKQLCHLISHLLASSHGSSINLQFVAAFLRHFVICSAAVERNIFIPDLYLQAAVKLAPVKSGVGCVLTACLNLLLLRFYRTIICRRERVNCVCEQKGSGQLLFVCFVVR